MAGDGTAKLGRLLFDYGHKGQNRVRDRVISIMSVWLAHYMSRTYGGKGFTFFIVSAPGHPMWGGKIHGKVTGPDRGLMRNCQSAVVARANSVSVLIGGTTVYYQNVKGEQI